VLYRILDFNASCLGFGVLVYVLSLIVYLLLWCLYRWREGFIIVGILGMLILCLLLVWMLVYECSCLAVVFYCVGFWMINY